MAVKFVESIRRALEMTHYGLAKQLGVTQQTVRKWTGKTKSDRPQTGMDLVALCRLRRLSKKSWSQFGRLLDDEFLPKE